MSTVKTGGPAFPVSTGNPDAPHQDGHTTAQFPGMTLRDYFAAKALPLAFQYWRETSDGVDPDFVFNGVEDDSGLNLIAADCYAMADAMLRARESTHA